MRRVMSGMGCGILSGITSRADEASWEKGEGRGAWGVFWVVRDHVYGLLDMGALKHFGV